MADQDPAQQSTKTIEFEGTQHVFPADASDDEISKALGGGTAATTATTGAAAGGPSSFRTGLSLQPPPTPPTAPKPDPNAPNPYVQAAKGAARGVGDTFAAQGEVDPKEPFFSSKNAIAGVKATGQMYAKAGADAAMTGGMSIPAGIVSGLYGAGKELWQTKFSDDPESFGHALGSLGTQLLALRSIHKGITGEPTPDKATANIASGLGITGKVVEAFRKSGVVDVLQNAGVKTIGGALDAVTTASKYIDQKFNQGLAQIGSQPYLPVEIQNRINGLITPDMQKTAEGRQQISYIRAKAREYSNPWTLNQLNAKRMTENANLDSYFDKGSQGQVASALDQKISKAVRDGAAEIVYGEAQRTGAVPDAQALKQQQGGLWTMKDLIHDRVNDLDAKQLDKKAQTGSDKLKPRVSISESGRPRGYLAGLADAVMSGDPKAEANAKIARGANPSIADKIDKYSSPVHAWPVVGLLSRDGTIDDGTKQYDRAMSPPPRTQ